MDTESVIKLVQKYLQVLKEEGIEIDRAFLYGSYAKQTQTENSDIDLLLVSNLFDTSNDYLVGKIWALTKNVSTKIEPYVIGSSKFENDKISPLIQIVKKEGLEIAC